MQMKANLLVEAAESGFMGQDAGSFTVAQLGEGGTRARRMSYVTPDVSLRECYTRQRLARRGY